MSLNRKRENVAEVKMKDEKKNKITSVGSEIFFFLAILQISDILFDYFVYRHFLSGWLYKFDMISSHFILIVGLASFVLWFVCWR